MATSAARLLHEAEVPVEFEDAREEALIRQAVLGSEAQDFLLSQVGRFVSGAAVQDQNAILEKLTTIKPNTPWRRRSIEALQQEYRAIELAIGWLTEAVKLGSAAHRQAQIDYDERYSQG